jgi:hypothetical protein
MACCKILTQHLPGGTEEKLDEPQSRYAVSGPRLEPPESPDYEGWLIITSLTSANECQCEEG